MNDKKEVPPAYTYCRKCGCDDGLILTFSGSITNNRISQRVACNLCGGSHVVDVLTKTVVTLSEPIVTKSAIAKRKLKEGEFVTDDDVSFDSEVQDNELVHNIALFRIIEIVGDHVLVDKKPISLDCKEAVKFLPGEFLDKHYSVVDENCSVVLFRKL